MNSWKTTSTSLTSAIDSKWLKRCLERKELGYCNYGMTNLPAAERATKAKAIIASTFNIADIVVAVTLPFVLLWSKTEPTLMFSCVTRRRDKCVRG